MKLFTKNIACLLLLISSCTSSVHASVYVDESLVYKEKAEKKHADACDRDYYSTHLITSYFTQQGTSMLAEAALTFMYDNKPYSWFSNDWRTLCKGVGLGLGTIAVYIRYKMPQWTDTHLLGINKKRTKKQNSIRFVHEVFLGPLGILTGEYFAHNGEDTATTN